MDSINSTQLFFFFFTVELRENILTLRLSSTKSVTVTLLLGLTFWPPWSDYVRGYWQTEVLKIWTSGAS